MKKVLAVLAILILASSMVFANGEKESAAANGEKVYKIGISKFLAHPALDASEQGFKEYLATTGLNITYDSQNAQGDISTTATIAQKFKDDNVDLAYGIATPTAQALANALPYTPVVFAAVTDPVDAGLVNDWTGSSDILVCGTSDSSPVEAQIKLLADITGAKVIGNVYNSSEANATVQQALIKEACSNLGLEFISAAITNSSEVRQATQSIIDRVDAIYVATDNAVVSALPALDEVAYGAKKPVLCGDPTSTKGLNILIAWGFDYYAIGVSAGKQAEAILKGANAGEQGSIVLSDPADFELWFNLDTAKAFGITIPQEQIDVAVGVIENGVEITK
ncbi:MAG: ABC transporter substrate-binding protein [Spirochaetales bacterium]|nr:ABC transporter substrate-binding protein [Spirochaetales bacterium]